MSHPYINREIKCAFRWYRSPMLRHRMRTRDIDPDVPDSCPPSLAFPARTILPFQALLEAGTSAIASWRVKTRDGVQVLNLDSSIPSLVLAEYTDPDRCIVCLERPLRMDAIPVGVHEMEITTAEGEVVYSETLEWACPKPGAALSNSNVGSGFTGWSYGTWSGRLAAKENGSGPPAHSPQDGDRVATLGDNLLWTYTDGSWVSSTPALNSYWGIGPSSTFLVYTGGGWATPVTAPVVFSPTPCWGGLAGVHWSYDLPAGFDEGFVQVGFTVFYGSPITGSVSLWVGGVLIGTYGQAQNGLGQEVVVWMEAGQSIEFRPTANFVGCVMGTSFLRVSDGSDCWTMLRWRDCGDLGTVAYTIGSGEFTNVLYLRESGCLNVGAVYDPTPQITEGVQNDAQGNPVRDRRRKDVDWSLELAFVPWHSLDAISELVVSSYRAIRVPWGGNEDEMVSARLETVWDSRNRVANATLIFQVGEATTASGCCDLFPRPCPDPCEADKVYGVHALVVGDRYLYLNGTVATYCGPECGQVQDENGFNEIEACPIGLASTGEVGYEIMLWDGSAWVLALAILSAEIISDDNPLRIEVVGTIPAWCTGKIQTSEDGDEWIDGDATFSAAEIEEGITVEMPDGTQYIRIVAMGDECDLAAGRTTIAPGACPTWVFSSNLTPNCENIPILVTILALPYDAPTGVLPMVELGEEVVIEYRFDGLDWQPATANTTGANYVTDTPEYTTPGQLLQVRITMPERPWCDPVISQEFSCPA